MPAYPGNSDAMACFFRQRVRKPPVPAVRTLRCGGGCGLVAFLGGMLLILGSGWLRAAPDLTVEDRVKAAVVVKLAKFVEWPAEAVAPKEPLPVCLFAGTRLAGVLGSIGHMTVQDHPLSLVLLTATTDPRLGQCRIVFIGETESVFVGPVIRAVQSLPILTVSDLPGFAMQGGMIGLVEVDQHLGFEVNLSAAKRGHITISSQLLELAKIIE